MNEIEKRAKEYAKNQLWGIALEDDEYEQRYNSIVELYLEIATEQKSIDIERACDAYCHHCPNYADDAIGLQGCSGGGCDVLRDFRKAMEE